MSLLSLPEEVIYLILEVGRLDVKDGVALSEVCRRLKSVSQCTPYWMCIATTATRRNGPLPINPRLALHSILPDELRHILIRYDRSSKNLAAQEPKVCTSRTLSLAVGQSPVACSAFAHGGTRFLIAYRHGLIQLWDIAHTLSAPSFSGTCRIILEAGARPTNVGRLLGEYDTGIDPCSLNFQTSDEHGYLVVAVASQSQLYSRAIICVISFTETGKDSYATREVFRTKITIGFHRPRTAVYGRLACLLFETEFKLGFAVFDYATGHGRIIVTTDSWHHFCIASTVSITKGEDVVLVTSSGDALEVDIYFNIRAVLISSEDARPLRIVQPSDATIKIPYKKRCQMEHGRTWQTQSARDVVDTGQIPIITTSRTLTNLDVMTSEWLDVEDLVRAAKSEHRVTQPLPRGRNFFKHPSRVASSLQTSHLWTIGSKGCHELFIDRPTPSTGPKLNLVTLQSLGYDSKVGHDMSKRSRYLLLPISVDRIAEILAFCDEDAVLAVLTDACRTGCCPPSVLFFTY